MLGTFYVIGLRRSTEVNDPTITERISMGLDLWIVAWSLPIVIGVVTSFSSQKDVRAVPRAGCRTS